MVVPAVGVVIQNDHRGFRPFRALLQGVDDPDQEMLLVDRIRISGMPIFERRRLQEAHGRQVTCLERAEEVMDVILVIGRIRGVGMRDQAVTDGLDRARTGVRRIPGRRIVLEPGVVRDVIHRCERRRARRGRVGFPRAAGRAVGVDDGEIEPAHERTPGDTLGIEQIADVLAGHRDLIERRVRADVLQRVAVADLGDVAGDMGCVAERLVGAVQKIARAVENVERGGDAVGLARDQVDGAGRRGTELRRIIVVVQGEMLGVVPHRGDGVAVKITHHQCLAADAGRRGARGADEGREAVHQPVIIGAFLRTFIVPLVSRERL